MSDERRRKTFTEGLRQLADFLDAHPEVPAPYFSSLGVWANSREELATIARSGTWQKEYTSQYFTLKKSFGENLTLQATADRETVCRKVVVGTRIEPARPEREVEVVEWVCEDATLLASKES